MSSKPHAPKTSKAAEEPRKTETDAEKHGEVSGPMSNDAVHKTEAKDHHPMGKTRHGGRSA